MNLQPWMIPEHLAPGDAKSLEGDWAGMELHRITSVLVVDAQGQLCGALNTNDLMRAKVI